GGVVVTSAIGTGTSIEVLLPAVQQAAIAEHGTTVASPSTGTETILVVEDEDGVRNLIAAVLRDLGYSVFTCSDPFAAIEICRQPGRIDLLVTDLILPHVNGAKMAESLTRNRPELRVLYVSGYSLEYFSERKLVFPGGSFLSKPFTREMLAEKVREALDQRKARLVRTE